MNANEKRKKRADGMSALEIAQLPSAAGDWTTGDLLRVEEIISRARAEGWRDACSAVSDTISVTSMAPDRPTLDDLKAAGNTVVRARSIVTEVSRRGPPNARF